MNINTLCRLIDERKNELFELLSELIKINSESFGERGNEEECARYVYELCQKLGLESDMFSPMDIQNFDKMCLSYLCLSFSFRCFSHPTGQQVHTT